MKSSYSLKIAILSALFVLFGSLFIENSKADDFIKDQLCIDACPYRTSQNNNIIIDNEIFILSQNKNTKFADWVAYKVTPKNINADVKTSRNWKKDPKISEGYVLIPSDYKGAYKKCNYDRGHQAPLASFKGDDWKKTNYTSNLTPQKADLNRGAWLKLENKVRELVNRENKSVYVMTGTYYNKGEELCRLETRRIDYKIPSGYWKIIAIEEDDKLKVASFMFPQNAKRKDGYCKYQSSIKEIELISNLRFFGEDNSNSYPLKMGCD